jgi:hypothetical protein
MGNQTAMMNWQGKKSCWRGESPTNTQIKGKIEHTQRALSQPNSHLGKGWCGTDGIELKARE